MVGRYARGVGESAGSPSRPIEPNVSAARIRDLRLDGGGGDDDGDQQSSHFVQTAERQQRDAYSHHYGHDYQDQEHQDQQEQEEQYQSTRTRASPLREAQEEVFNPHQRRYHQSVHRSGSSAGAYWTGGVQQQIANPNHHEQSSVHIQPQQVYHRRRGQESDAQGLHQQEEHQRHTPNTYHQPDYQSRHSLPSQQQLIGINRSNSYDSFEYDHQQQSQHLSLGLRRSFTGKRKASDEAMEGEIGEIGEMGGIPDFGGAGVYNSAGARYYDNISVHITMSDGHDGVNTNSTNQHHQLSARDQREDPALLAPATQTRRRSPHPSSQTHFQSHSQHLHSDQQQQQQQQQQQYDDYHRSDSTRRSWLHHHSPPAQHQQEQGEEETKVFPIIQQATSSNRNITTPISTGSTESDSRRRRSSSLSPPPLMRASIIPRTHSQSSNYAPAGDSTTAATSATRNRRAPSPPPSQQAQPPSALLPSQGRVITNASRNITFPMLQPHFERPLQEAALRFGVCTTLLKKICRKNGIKNWPFRRICGLHKSIASMEKQVHYFDGEQKRSYADQLYKLQLELEAYRRTGNAPTPAFEAKMKAESGILNLVPLVDDGDQSRRRQGGLGSPDTVMQEDKERDDGNGDKCDDANAAETKTEDVEIVQVSYTHESEDVDDDGMGADAPLLPPTLSAVSTRVSVSSFRYAPSSTSQVQEEGREKREVDHSASRNCTHRHHQQHQYASVRRVMASTVDLGDNDNESGAYQQHQRRFELEYQHHHQQQCQTHFGDQQSSRLPQQQQQQLHRHHHHHHASRPMALTGNKHAAMVRPLHRVLPSLSFMLHRQSLSQHVSQPESAAQDNSTSSPPTVRLKQYSPSSTRSNSPSSLAGGIQML